MHALLHGHVLMDFPSNKSVMYEICFLYIIGHLTQSTLEVLNVATLKIQTKLFYQLLTMVLDYLNFFILSTFSKTYPL